VPFISQTPGGPLFVLEQKVGLDRRR
jgi:hypothetical protein